MGHFIPVFLAFMLNLRGIYIFVIPKSCDCLPYLSYLIFLTSIYFLLLDVKLTPRSFRRLNILPLWFIEFTVAKLLMEFFVDRFWVPLELTVITFLPSVAKTMERHFGSLAFVFAFLSWPFTLLIANYLLSIFFFVCFSHGTRRLDYTIIKDCGFGHFITDAIHRLKCNIYCNLRRFAQGKKPRRAKRAEYQWCSCTCVPPACKKCCVERKESDSNTSNDSDPGDACNDPKNYAATFL